MGAVVELTKEQEAVKLAFADAIKVERPTFVQEGIEQLDEVIRHTIDKVFESVSDIDDEGVATELKDHLVEMMFECTRRGLQRAIKTMAKGCDIE